MSFFYSLIIIGLMMLLNAVFAAYEMALASIPRVRLQFLVNQKSKTAKDALFMKENMEASLAVVQVGITLVGAIAAATGGFNISEKLVPFFIERLGILKFWADFLGIIFVVLPLSALTIIFAELIPKTIAINNKEFVCLFLSPFMKIIFIFIEPVIRFLESLVKNIINLLTSVFGLKNKISSVKQIDELLIAASMAREDKLIGAREEKIVLSAAGFSYRKIKEIVIPISEVVSVPLDASLEKALVLAHLDMHTRFLVRENSIVKGYLNFKDIIAALHINPSEPTVKGIMRPIRIVDDDAAIAQVLEIMIQEKQHIVLVKDKTKQIDLGMVTLEDIIEELVGDIEDEFDKLPNCINVFGKGWLVGGGVSIGRLKEVLGEDVFKSFDNNLKFADWCCQIAGVDLKGTDTFEKDMLSVTIRKLRRKKVSEAIVSKINI